jgi:hypothetical protein
MLVLTQLVCGRPKFVCLYAGRGRGVFVFFLAFCLVALIYRNQIDFIFAVTFHIT